ncbi:MAG: TrmH family RNA methyltransferase [Bacteroidales bacterium]
MISKSQLQYVRSLQQKKFRTLHRQFVAEGRKMIAELLNSKIQVEQIFAVAEWEAPPELSIRKSITVTSVSPKELERMSGFNTPDQVLAVAQIPDMEKLMPDQLQGLVLMLDGIGDPGNFGTIVRIADWFGVETVVCSENCVEAFNPKVVQAAMGSLFRVKVYVENLKDVLNDPARKLPVYGAVMDGENVYDQEFPPGAILVIGSESHGISGGVELLLDKRLTIPSAGGRAESLNAAVAAGILCSEFKRKTLENAGIF